MKKLFTIFAFLNLCHAPNQTRSESSWEDMSTKVISEESLFAENIEVIFECLSEFLAKDFKEHPEPLRAFEFNIIMNDSDGESWFYSDDQEITLPLSSMLYSQGKNIILDKIIRRAEWLYNSEESTKKEQLQALKKTIAQFYKKTTEYSTNEYGSYFSDYFKDDEASLFDSFRLEPENFEYTFSKFWKDKNCMRLFLEINTTAETADQFLQIIEDLKSTNPTFSNVNFPWMFFEADCNLNTFFENVMKLHPSSGRYKKWYSELPLTRGSIDQYRISVLNKATAYANIKYDEISWDLIYDYSDFILNPLNDILSQVKTAHDHYLEAISLLYL